MEGESLSQRAIAKRVDLEHSRVRSILMGAEQRIDRFPTNISKEELSKIARRISLDVMLKQAQQRKLFKELQQQIRQILVEFSLQEQQILGWRFGLNDGIIKSYKLVADMAAKDFLENYDYMRVVRLERRALERTKSLFGNKAISFIPPKKEMPFTLGERQAIAERIKSNPDLLSRFSARDQEIIKALFFSGTPNKAELARRYNPSPRSINFIEDKLLKVIAPERMAKSVPEGVILELMRIK